MKVKKNMLEPQIEEDFHSVGIDLTLIETLVKVMDCIIIDEYNITQVDIANLTIVIKRLLKIVKDKYDKIESCLNI